MSFNFTAEYAKTGRSMCKGCKRNIANKKLRIGVQQASSESSKSSFNTMRWYHPRARCLAELKKKPAWWEENCPAGEEWEGFEGLDEPEQEALISVIEELCHGSKPKEVKKVEKAKRQESEGEAGGESGEGDSDEDSEAPPPPAKKEVASAKGKAAETKAAPKKPVSKKEDVTPAKKAPPKEEDTGSDEGSESQSEREDDKGHDDPKADMESESGEGADGSGSEDDEAEDEEDKPKAKKPPVKGKAPASKKRAKRDYDSASSRSGSDAESDESPRKKKKTKPAPKKASGKGKKPTSEYTADSLDDETVDKINAAIDKLASKTLPVLKEMLRKNGQKMSGTKAEVLERIGEGTVLGALPKCEECGASLRFDKDDGVYSCPGKYEDGQMKRCSFTSKSVERIPWR